jgi:formylglycine-generating enzyme required for sulfatase activity
MKKVMLLVAMSGVMISCGNPSSDDDDGNNNSHKNGEVYSPDGIEMVYVEGSDTVKGFYIGKYEVTQKQYQDVMSVDVNPLGSKVSDSPVENVSWDDAQEFIDTLNARTGRNYRLPTEAEWEYAAREGTKKSSYEYSGSNNIDEVAWYDDYDDDYDSGNGTHPVGQKKANALGIYDMSGNVYEWCQDYYGGNSYRVYRGGSWSSHAKGCRVAHRGISYPDTRSYSIGFRLVLSSCGSSSSDNNNNTPKNGDAYNPNGIDMVYVEGSDTVKGFYIGKYEVTQKQYQNVMDAAPSRFKGDDRPVEQVSWDDAQEFIKKLNARTGRSYRLPTEAEWSYAACEGTKRSSYEYSGSNNINEVAWYRENSNSETHPVGQKKANALGIYDMSGNVWEWCQDYSSSGSLHRVLRGGCWYDYAGFCRVVDRSSDDPGNSSYDLGFRLALP